MVGERGMGFEAGQGHCATRHLFYAGILLKSVRQAVEALFQIKVLIPQIQGLSPRQAPPPGARRPLCLADDCLWR